MLALKTTNVTAMWPPTGLALAAVLLFGFRIWPAIALAALFTNLDSFNALGFTNPLALAGAFSTAFGQTLGALGSGYLALRFTSGRNPFDHSYDIAKFALFGALIGTIPSAVIGASTLSILYGTWSNFAITWLTWWLGDAAAILIITPLIMTWNMRLKSGWTPFKLTESGVLLVLLFLVGWFVFGKGLSLPYLFIPILIWSAFRFGKFEAACLIFLMLCLSIWGSAKGVFIYGFVSHRDSLLLTQLFISIVSVMTMMISSLISERAAALADMRRSNEELQYEIAVRSRAEESLRRARDEMEAQVAERTMELREKDQLLIMQSRQAAMGEMMGNIAHQWRQPLNSVALIMQLLILKHESGELDRDDLETMGSQVMEMIQYMSRTIDDFRNYFKPDKEKATFLVGSAVQRTLSLVEASFKNRCIATEVRMEDDPLITGFPNEYAQVLLNILQNAKDAFEESKVAPSKVTITVKKEKGRSVVIISDNAGGIPGDIIYKVFDPYFTTKGPDKGTGVGLFMSKAIIEKNMGGRLTVRNTVDGAEFRIEL